MSPRPSSVTHTAALLTCFTALSGCGLIGVLSGSYDPPQVRVHDSKVDTVTKTAAAITVSLLIHNPNAYSLSVRELTYRLQIGGKLLAEGISSATVSLPAHGEASISLPLSLHFDALRAAAPNALMVGEVPYELSGTVALAMLFGERQVQFSTTSALRLNLPLGLAMAPKPGQDKGASAVRDGMICEPVHLAPRRCGAA